MEELFASKTYCNDYKGKKESKKEKHQPCHMTNWAKIAKQWPSLVDKLE